MTEEKNNATKSEIKSKQNIADWVAGQAYFSEISVEQFLHKIELTSILSIDVIGHTGKNIVEALIKKLNAFNSSKQISDKIQ